MKEIESQLRAGKTFKIKQNTLIYDKTFSMFYLYNTETINQQNAKIFCNEDLRQLMVSAMLDIDDFILI